MLLRFLGCSCSKEAITGNWGGKKIDATHSAVLKGYAITSVLLSHVGNYSGINGVEYPSGVGVSIFLILSGYGICESYRKNGQAEFWKKRWMRVVLPYWVAQTLYMIVTGSIQPIKTAVLDYLLIVPMPPFGWYLRMIFLCYIMFYCVYRIWNDKTKRLAVLCVCCTAFFVFKTWVIIDEVWFLQPRQAFAFWVGVLLSENKEYCIALYEDWKRSVFLIVFSTSIYAMLHLDISVTLTTALYNVLSLFTCMLCAMGIIGITAKWKWTHNQGMIWMSVISYELYLVHGYFLCIAVHNVLVFLLLTTLCAVALHKITMFSKRKVVGV